MKKIYRLVTLLVCMLLVIGAAGLPVAATTVTTVGLTLCQGDMVRQTEGISAVTINDTLCISMAQLARYTGASVVWYPSSQVAAFENYSGTALVCSSVAAVYKVDASQPLVDAPSEDVSVMVDTNDESAGKPEIREPSAEYSVLSRLTVPATSELIANNDELLWNYQRVKQSKPSVMVNDSRYLPLSYLTALGYTYDWNGQTLTLMVPIGVYRCSALAAAPSELDAAWKAIKADIATAKANEVLATYTTYFDTGLVNRSTNLRLATNAINGTVVQPGEIFSFNKTVGPRTYARGYRSAIIFVGGAQVYGLGGGICQVSSTLYNVCLFSNMTIVERRPHGLPVSYVPSGRDATVSWGSIDFRFKNNRDYAIKIIAGTSGGTLTVSFKRA